MVPHLPVNFLFFLTALLSFDVIRILIILLALIIWVVIDPILDKNPFPQSYKGSSDRIRDHVRDHGEEVDTNAYIYANWI